MSKFIQKISCFIKRFCSGTQQYINKSISWYLIWSIFRMCFLPSILFYCFHKSCCLLIQRFPSIIFSINQFGEIAGSMAPRSSLSPVREWRLQLLLFLSPYWGICRRQIVFKVWIDIDSCACDATPVQRRVILTIPYVRQFMALTSPVHGCPISMSWGVGRARFWT